MSNRERESMNEKDFESCVSELPPVNIAEAAVPWKKAVNRILTGMVLNAIIFNFWYLNYILPFGGMVLCLLGFRTLRKENKWFGNCFIITVIRMVYLFLMLILNTTIIRSFIFDLPITSVSAIAGLLLLFAEFFCFWRGLRAVQQKAELPPRACGGALIIWYAFLCFLAVVQYNGLVIAGGMIIGYIVIIRSIYRLSEEIDEAGYSIQAAPVIATDKCIVFTLVLALIIGCGCGWLFGGSYPMDWGTIDMSEHNEVKDIKSHLMELGFPEYVLNDLSPEDIAACDGALQVVVDVTDKAVKELRITGIGVQIPGEREKWIIFHHFLWTVNPGFYGTESIQIWPVYRNISKGWASDGEVTGRVLYDKNGKCFAAPYYSIGSQILTSDNIFWAQTTNTDVFAAFSMPAKGENCRGYVAYPIEEIQDDYIISSWINYTHQRSWFQYPAVTAMEKRMTNSWNEAGAFITVQNALQFYPKAEGAEMIR